MKLYQSKILIFFIALILIIYTIYHLFFNIETKRKSEEKYVAKETMIANDIRLGIVEFDTMNPILSNNRNVQEIARLIYEPLITLSQDYRLEPCLAKEWTQIDNTHYLIKLNEQIEWQDGTKLNADDVIFTINKIREKKKESIYAYNIENIKSVQKIDEYTIKLTIQKEEPYFEYNLIFPIIPKQYFQKNSFEAIKEKKGPIGTGMYYISQVNSNVIILKRNLNWWKAKEAKIDTIQIKLYSTMNQELEDFKNNNVDIITSSNLDIEKYLEGIQYHKVEFIHRNYTYLMLKQYLELKERAVRQAINDAIHREEIVQEIFHNKYKVSYFPLDFGNYLYKDFMGTEKVNREEIKKILKSNNWIYSKGYWRKKNNQKLQFQLLINKEKKEQIKVAEKLEMQLEKQGIQINIVPLNQNKYQQRLQSGQYEIVLANKNFSYSPSLYTYFEDKNISNNKEIIKLLNQMESANNEQEAKEILIKIKEIYDEEIPIIGLYYDTITMIYTPNLRGEIKPNSYNLFYGIEEWYRRVLI